MSLGFKITGLGQMQENIEKLQNNINNIPKHQEVTFDKLINDSFMQEFTKFKSFQEMLNNSGFKVKQ